MSVLSLLTGIGIAGMVYGLSFLPTASLARPDDEVGLGLKEVEVGDLGIRQETA